MIKSHWLRLLLFTLAGGAVALTLSLLSPKKYEAIMQILIDQPQTRPAMPPQGPTEGKVAEVIGFSGARSVSTQVEQLTSFGVLREAAERARAELRLPDDDDELDPQNLQYAINIAADITSDIITIRIRMSDPKKAVVTAQEIYKAYEAQKARTTRQAGGQATESVQGLVNKLQAQLALIDTRVAELQKSVAGPDLTTKVTAEVTSLSKLEDSRDAAQISLAAVDARIKGLERELKLMPDKVVGSEAESANPNINAMEGQLAQARSDRATLLLRYLPDHDVVQAMDAKIQGIKEEIAAAKKRLKSSSVTNLNPTKEKFASDLAESRTSRTALARQLAAINTAIANRKTLERQLPDIQKEYQQLIREQLGLQAKYTESKAELETLRALERGRISPSRLVSQPAALPDPVSPKHQVNLMFGLVAGLILGVLSMLSAEGKRQPIRSLAQLNALSTQPVYRIIPELRMPFRGLNKAPAEPFETLLVNFRRSDKRPYRIGVVGITKDAGASITALNMALAAEKHGNRAMIIETDERSTIRRLLGRQGIPVEQRMAQVSPGVTLFSVDSLRQVQQPDGSSGFESEIERAQEDLVVIDFEPATESAEYAFAASQLDEMVVLVRAERTKSVEFLHAQQALSESGCPIVTVVFARSSDLQLVTDIVEPAERTKALAP